MRRTRLRWNPEQRVPATAAIHASRDTSDPEYVTWTFVAYDTARLPDVQSAWIATGILTQSTRGIVSTVMAARPGYGPFLYTLAATYTGATVFPSDDRSADAMRFWRRQPDACVYSMTDAAFALRFGKDIARMERGDCATKTQVAVLVDYGVKKSFGAEAERANPEKRVPAHAALFVEQMRFPDPDYVEYEMTLYDAAKLPNVEEAWIGSARISGFRAKLTPFTMAARRGYGPLMYTLAANYAHEAIYPSADRSEDALRFWARQEAGRVLPVANAAFKSRFGKTLSEMQHEHLSSRTPPRLMRRLRELGRNAAIGA